ncbi:MAG: DNA-processing protein DprA [Actinomycetota bacterium]
MPAERLPLADDDEMQPRPTWPDAFVTTTEDLRAALVLSGLRGITPRRLIAVAAERGSAAATLAAIRQGRAGSENDRAFARTMDGEEISAVVAACGARIVPWGSAEYPAQLVNIHDPPGVLYVIGRPAPDPTRAVAVVGARRCTQLGRELGASIGRALALAGVVVVSGAARGIDAAAHEGALDGGGTTLAVLGCGIDAVYPAGSRTLVRRIGASGTVLSEYPPGTPPVQRNFPARNRIVAGLCSATVVVEGAKGSGSMISAEHAMEFGRDVYAVPGAVTNPLAEVPLRLIRDGATMIRGAGDLLDDLGLELDAEKVVERLEISEDERRALAELTGPTLPDRVATALGVTIPQAVSLLMRLELRGFVRSVGGRYESTLKAGAASG